MNKDALLATLIGFGIGLLITGLLLVSPSLTKWFPKFSMPKLSFLQTQKKGTPTPTPPPAQFSVTIDSPLADTIENTSELLVSGVTTSNTTVVVQGPLDEAVVLTKDDGKYAGKVTLTEGKNDITVTAFTKTKQATVTVTIFYTPEEL